MPSLTELMQTYIQDRLARKLEKLDKDYKKQLDSLAADSEELAACESEHSENRQKLLEAHQVSTWLDKAAQKAKEITLVTHAPKFTHGDAKGSGILVSETKDNGYVQTAALKNKFVDVIGNAAALDVANLLMLQDESGQHVADAVLKKDMTAFKPFTQNQAQLEAWQQGFAAALDNKDKIASHTLSKQIYFPIDPQAKNYHLISPLHSSALSQAIYDRISHARYSEEAKATRSAHRNEEYSDQTDIKFPSLAVQSFGGSKPQNISLGNSQRHGKTWLLSCCPPSWEQQDKRLGRDKDFWRHLDYEIREEKKALREFLEPVKNQDSTLEIRTQRQQLLQDIFDQCFAVVAQFRQRSGGWSKHSTLSPCLRYLLDCGYEDEAPMNWLNDIAADFATLINNALQKSWTEKTGLVMGDAEYREWKKEFSEKLAEFMKEIGDWQ